MPDIILYRSVLEIPVHQEDDTVFDIGRSVSGTAVECTPTDVLDTVWNSYPGKRGVSAECVGTYGFYAVGDVDRYEK